MTCQDCIHFEVCGYHITELTPMTVNECPNFKPKSRFVELPCEVGQTVYFVGLLTQQIVPSKVLSISYNEGGFHLFCANHLIVTVTEQLGKTVFLSREEAENALPRKEDEGK